MKTPTLEEFQTEAKSRKTREYTLSNITAFQSFQYCSSLQLQQSTKECRICLQQIQDINHVFISPCRCIGTLRYVHQGCFMTWLERQYESKPPNEQKKMRQRGVNCQICKLRVFLTFATSRSCLSRENIAQRISTNRVLFMLLLLLQAIMLGSLIFLVYLIKLAVYNMGSDVILTSIFLTAAVFLIFGLVLTSCYLMGKFCLEDRTRVESFRLSSQSNNKRNVIPLQ